VARRTIWVWSSGAQWVTQRLRLPAARVAPHLGLEGPPGRRGCESGVEQLMQLAIVGHLVAGHRRPRVDVEVVFALGGSPRNDNRQVTTSQPVFLGQPSHQDFVSFTPHLPPPVPPPGLLPADPLDRVHRSRPSSWTPRTVRRPAAVDGWSLCATPRARWPGHYRAHAPRDHAPEARRQASTGGRMGTRRRLLISDFLLAVSGARPERRPRRGG
jgi:hypothetical protein